MNPHSTVAIDTLELTLTNPGDCCGNSMGLDNISLASLPEVTIDFNGLAGADGSPFASYKEYGFSVIPRRSISWLKGGRYGDPAPYIYFVAPAHTQDSGSIFVSHGGARFSFIAIDIYSSITNIPYVFRGFLNGASVFTVTGTLPNPAGNFEKVMDPHSMVPIDALEITLTNPPVCCDGPVGLDNIRLAIDDAKQELGAP